MSTRFASAYQSKIIQICFGFIFFAIVLYVTRKMMFGSRATAGLLAASVVFLAITFALDSRYWVISPLLMTGAFRIPGQRFDGFELACLSVTAIHFIRVGIHRDHAAHITRDIFPAIPLLCWMAFVFFLNPTGMSLLGSSSVGGRFYFKIVIGFTAMLALSTQRVDETGARWLFWGLLLSFTIRLARGVLSPGADPDAEVYVGAAPEVSARYAFITAASIYTLVFARKSLTDLLRSFGLIVLMGILALLTIYSGKRSAFARLALIPVFRTILVGRERLLTFVMMVLALMVMVFAIAGDGTLYRLPNSAKRALAVLNTKYTNQSGDGGAQDDFRATMREFAREEIRHDPLFGRKGFAMDFNEAVWVNMHNNPFAGHVMAGGWHSALYAYPADFGLPCLFFFLIFAWHVLRYTLRAPRIVVAGNYLPVICLYCSFELLFMFVFLYTSGHASTTTMELMLRYGLLMAVVRGYQEQQGQLQA